MGEASAHAAAAAVHEGGPLRQALSGAVEARPGGRKMERDDEAEGRMVQAGRLHSDCGDGGLSHGRG